MSQFGIDITFQFDPDASTIAASRGVPLHPSFRSCSSFFRANRSSFSPPRSRLTGRDGHL